MAFSGHDRSHLFLLVTIAILLSNHALAFVPLAGPSFAMRPTASSSQIMSMSSSASSSNSTVTSMPMDKSTIQLRQSPRKNVMPTHEKGPVTAVNSIEEFLDNVENTKENELVIVKFHAKFCKVCARVILKYKKMANKLTAPGVETQVPIRFISVESTANPKIIQQLGVKKFPFIQIYRNKECVASFGTGPAHNFQRMVGSTVDQKLSTSQSDWDAFRAEFKEEISSGLENLELLRLQAVLEDECSLMDENETCVNP